MSSDDETFQTGDSGASLTIPVTAGSLKKGHHVNINGFPCKIIEITTSKTGKHGHAKANITALDIFTNKKYEEVAPTSHNLEQPLVKREELQLIDIAQDGTLSLMDDAMETREDLNLPDDQEAAKAMQAAYDAGEELLVVVLSAMGKTQVMGHKKAGAGDS